MNLGRTVLSQLLDFLPTYQFQLSRSIPGKSLRQRILLLGSVLRQAFAQLTYRESLRDIEACPPSNPSFFTRTSGVKSLAIPWPMPTSIGT
jgi:hypothetical protein